jgi:hypothetical protein
VRCWRNTGWNTMSATSGVDVRPSWRRDATPRNWGISIPALKGRATIGASRRDAGGLGRREGRLATLYGNWALQWPGTGTTKPVSHRLATTNGRPAFHRQGGLTATYKYDAYPAAAKQTTRRRVWLPIGRAAVAGPHFALVSSPDGKLRATFSLRNSEESSLWCCSHCFHNRVTPRYGTAGWNPPSQSSCRFQGPSVSQTSSHL